MQSYRTVVCRGIYVCVPGRGNLCPVSVAEALPQDFGASGVWLSLSLPKLLPSTLPTHPTPTYQIMGMFQTSFPFRKVWQRQEAASSSSGLCRWKAQLQWRLQPLGSTVSQRNEHILPKKCVDTGFHNTPIHYSRR